MSKENDFTLKVTVLDFVSQVSYGSINICRNKMSNDVVKFY